jgi:hypothetical protein
MFGQPRTGLADDATCLFKGPFGGGGKDLPIPVSGLRQNPAGSGVISPSSGIRRITASDLIGGGADILTITQIYY